MGNVFKNVLKNKNGIWILIWIKINCFDLYVKYIMIDINKNIIKYYKLCIENVFKIWFFGFKILN